MPIQHAIWKVGTQPTLLSVGKLASKQKLEQPLASRITAKKVRPDSAPL